MDNSGDGIDTAERILRAATELLETEGYAAVSMRRVGKLAGISQAAIYRHYRDKDELVLRIVGEGYGDLVRTLEGLVSGKASPEEKLFAAFRGYIDFTMKRPALFKALFLRDIGRAGRAVNVLDSGVSRQRRSFELLTGVLRQGMDEGCFEPADAELTGQVLWSAVFGLAARLAIEGASPKKVAALAERELGILVRGLRPVGR